MFYDRSSPPLIKTSSDRFRYTIPGLFEEWMPTGTSFFGTDSLLLTMHPTGDRADRGEDGALLVVMQRGGNGQVRKIFRLVDNLGSRNHLNITARGVAHVLDWVYISDDSADVPGQNGIPRGNRVFGFKAADIRAGLSRGSDPEDLPIGTIDVDIPNLVDISQPAVFVVDCVASGLYFRDGDDDKELLWVFEHYRPAD